MNPPGCVDKEVARMLDYCAYSMHCISLILISYFGIDIEFSTRWTNLYI